jgi:hypothetical protein
MSVFPSENSRKSQAAVSTAGEASSSVKAVDAGVSNSKCARYFFAWITVLYLILIYGWPTTSCWMGQRLIGCGF